MPRWLTKEVGSPHAARCDREPAAGSGIASTDRGDEIGRLNAWIVDVGPARLDTADTVADDSLSRARAASTVLDCRTSCYAAATLDGDLEHLGLGRDDLSDEYYVALLRFLGCIADAHEFAELVGGDDIALRAAIAPVLGGPRPNSPRA